MIVDPNVNPEEARMELTRRSKLWALLKDLENDCKDTAILLETLGAKLLAMKLDGPIESFENIGSYIKSRNKAYVEMQTLIDNISKWEQAYFEWMASEHGEEQVTNKLSQAMKGAENE